jgi:hypothetical protein
MDNLSFNTIFFTGKAREGKWTGVLVSPESEDTLKFGQLFAVVSLSAPSSFDSKRAGDLLIKNIQDVYYESKSEKSILARIEKACMSTAKRLEYLLEREEIAAEEGIDLNIEVFVTYDEFVYMAILGEGNVMLLRDKALINLTEGLKDLSGRSLIRSGSGKFSKGDSFILLSPAATLNVSEQELKESIKNLSLERIESKKDDPSLGLLILSITSTQEAREDIVSGDLDGRASNELKQEQESMPAPIEGVKDELEVNSKDLFQDDLDKKDSSESIKKLNEKENISKEYIGDPNRKEAAIKSGETRTGESKLASLKNKVKSKLSDKKTYKVIWMKILEFLRKVGKFFKVYIWDGFLGLGGGGLYLKGSNPKKSMRGIIILIVLAASLLFLSIRSIQGIKNKGERTDEVQQVLSEIDEKFSNGRNLGEAGNISEAVIILEEAMNQLASVKEHGVLIEEIETKESEGIGILDEVRRVIILTDDNIVTDVAGYMEGASA